MYVGAGDNPRGGASHRGRAAWRSDLGREEEDRTPDGTGRRPCSPRRGNIPHYSSIEIENRRSNGNETKSMWKGHYGRHRPLY